MATATRLRTCRFVGLACTLILSMFVGALIVRSWRTSKPLAVRSSLETRDPFDDLPELPSNSTISKRNLVSWEESIEKGRNLLGAMEQPNSARPQIVPQSSWTHLDSLPQCGWSFSLDYGMKDIHGLDTALQALGIDTSPQAWTFIDLGHQKPTIEGPTNYPATWANFVALFNSATPALIAKMSYGPAYQAKVMGIPIRGKNQLPPLQRWSDLIYLAWQRVTTYYDRPADQQMLDIRANLEHVFRYQVSNQDTTDTFLRAHHGGTIPNPKEIPSAWPGWEFTPSSNSDAFKSVLSAPNVFGVAYLLASHKGDDQFKVKTIDRINAFDCVFRLPGRAPESRWCLYIHLANV